MKCLKIMMNDLFNPNFWLKHLSVKIESVVGVLGFRTRVGDSENYLY